MVKNHEFSLRLLLTNHGKGLVIIRLNQGLWVQNLTFSRLNHLMASLTQMKVGTHQCKCRFTLAHPWGFYYLVRFLVLSNSLLSAFPSFHFSTLLSLLTNYEKRWCANLFCCLKPPREWLRTCNLHLVPYFALARPMIFLCSQISWYVLFYNVN
jgi:hypothetical protein